MSTDFMTYLNYMATWDSESDANIDKLIAEHNYFVNLGDFEYDQEIDEEFKTLHDLACKVRDLTIAADATQIAADAAAVASIWSFGLGMAAFAALEATEAIEQKVISSKSKELNNKLTSADEDIAKKIGTKVSKYVTQYKLNNDLIVSKAPKGLDARTCRANLMQFMAGVEKNGTLDAAHFRQYASSCRRLFDSEEINDVYDALDKLNLSAKDDDDIEAFVGTLAGFKFPDKFAVDIVRSFCIAIMVYKLKIATTKIAKIAKAKGISVEEVDESAFEVMDACGKFVAVVAVIMSVVDVIFEILDIVDVVKQCKAMCDKLDGPIKQSYKDYFDGMKKASIQYQAAIAKKKASLA